MSKNIHEILKNCISTVCDFDILTFSKAPADFSMRHYLSYLRGVCIILLYQAIKRGVHIRRNPVIAVYKTYIFTLGDFQAGVTSRTLAPVRLINNLYIRA